MIKFRVQSSLFVVFFIAIFLPTTNSELLTVRAVDSTPSADIKFQLEQLKKEIASKAAKIKDEVNRKLKDKAYIGKVKLKSENSITVATKNGPKIININQDTEYVSKKSLGASNKKFSLKTLKEEDNLASLGDADETGVLTAKKIILLPTENLKLKTYLWGKVIAISDKLVTIKDKDGKNIAVSGIISKIMEGDTVILTGILNDPRSSSSKNGIFEAQFVYVLQKGKPMKTASPSATIKPATSSAKKKSS